jgi:phenylalanyl-tRNA synthetase beta chain
MAGARSGKRLGLHSEARVRFERGVDPEIAPVAVERFVALLASLPGGDTLRRGPTTDVQDPVFMPRGPVVSLRTARVNAILGIALSDDEVAALLTPIGFEVVASTAGVHEVTVPTWRLECSREIDLIEEVARMWGYRKIERSRPTGVRAATGGLTHRQRERRHIRGVLAGAGFSEAWTTTFLAPGDLERAGLDPTAVEVENPLDRSESILRTGLLPGLLKAVRFNTDRQAAEVSLFELGRVFHLPSEAGMVTPDEEEMLGVIVAPGPGATSTAAAEAAVRSWVWLSEALRLESTSVVATGRPGWHPTRAAVILGAAGLELGMAGEVAPEVVAAYGLPGRVGFLTVSVDRLGDEPRVPKRAVDISRYPASDLDLAFVVDDDVAASDVRDTLRRDGGDLVESVTLFDVYRSEAQLGIGRRSLAFRLRYRAPDRTLDEEELARTRSRAIDAVRAAHRAELRA